MGTDIRDKWEFGFFTCLYKLLVMGSELFTKQYVQSYLAKQVHMKNILQSRKITNLFTQ